VKSHTHTHTHTHLVVGDDTKSSRILRTPRLTKALLGNDSILVHEIDQHLPLSAIVRRVAQQMLDQSAIRRLATSSRLHKHTQQIVQSLHLVPEEDEVLTELEVFQFELLHDRNSHAVQHRKDPTATGAFLVCHRLPLRLDLLAHAVSLQCRRSTVGGLTALSAQMGHISAFDKYVEINWRKLKM